MDVQAACVWKCVHARAARWALAREEVEHAVDEFEEALLMCRGLQAARDALVKLATRGKE